RNTSGPPQRLGYPVPIPWNPVEASGCALSRSVSLWLAPDLAVDERQQIRVDRRRLSRGHTVRKSLIGLQNGALYQFRAQRPRIGVWHDLIVIAVHDQRWHRDFLEIFGEVRLRKRHDAVVVRFRSAHHSL